ncbi:MAG: gfo/Idh/MocA family oxidoreductase [Candidatus Omnitrophota bacterium]|jgi:predicted dehydrogenase|nr:MAG: gfo/Idh/MocA family oxidoreductase [Candidatus Omnitrophota bacterium]
MPIQQINRRSFVAQTATATAAGFIPAKSVMGANDRVVIGVIGIGRRGTTLLSDFLREEDVAVAAVCDVDETHLAHAIERTENHAKGFHDFRHMLEQKDIDAVVIGTPDHWHAIPTIYACRAGKDVYVEKPLSHNAREGQVMVKTARETGRIVQMGTQQRSEPHWQQAVDIVKSGTLGKICEIRAWNHFDSQIEGFGNPSDCDPPKEADYDFWLGPAPKRAFNPNRFHARAMYFWDYAGGCVTSWGVHLLDIAYWAMDLQGPLTVSAGGGKYYLQDNRETPDTFAAIFVCPDFLMTYHLHHWSSIAKTIDSYGKYGHGIEFYGADAALYVDRFRLELRGEGEDAPSLSVEGKNRDAPHIRNFLECVKTRQRPNSDVETGHRSSVSTFLANISYRTGRKITWDAKTETILNDPEASQYLAREPRAPWCL